MRALSTPKRGAWRDSSSTPWSASPLRYVVLWEEQGARSRGAHAPALHCVWMLGLCCARAGGATGEWHVSVQPAELGFTPDPKKPRSSL